jgi:spore maturation protein CgeB
MCEFSNEERAEMGQKGREHILKNYSYERYQTRWVEIMDETHEKFGSWRNKKLNPTWVMENV